MEIEELLIKVKDKEATVMSPSKAAPLIIAAP